jgi:phosphatidylserine/phosphatidylglycerophosphate/cardiolipin synthase-like enzyme
MNSPQVERFQPNAHSRRSRLRRALVSGLAYGLGLLLGNVVVWLIGTNISLQFLAIRAGFPELIAGILVMVVIADIGGAIGGFLGGWTLPDVGRPKGRWGNAWRSAVSLGLSYGGLLFMVGSVISLISFYDVFETPIHKFALLLLIVGAVFGSVAGLLLGLLTVGWRRTPRVALAGAAGFGLGGIGLGVGLHAFLMSVPVGVLAGGQLGYLLLGLFALGAGGGAVLGFVYSHLAQEPEKPPAAHSRLRVLVAYAVLAVIVVLLVAAISPFLQRLATVFTARSAELSAVIASDTVGTHWLDVVPVAGVVSSEVPGAGPEIAVSASDQVALVWSSASSGGQADVHLLPGTWDGEAQTTGQAPASCAPGSDATSMPLPAIAVNGDDVIMAVWPGETGGLVYSTWQASVGSPLSPEGCVPAEDSPLPGEQRLAGAPDGSFALVFNSNTGSAGEIRTIQHAEGEWTESSRQIGAGRLPEVYLDSRGTLHAAWCGTDDRVDYWLDGEESASFDSRCMSRPGLAMDTEGWMHVAWYGDGVENGPGNTVPGDVIFESIEANSGWSVPAIVARPDQPAQPALAAGPDGVLHMAWTEGQRGQEAVTYAAQVQYDCEAYPLDGITRAIRDVAQRTKYQPPGDTVPYCQNRFDRLFFVPNPDPTFSDQPPTPNGGFDGLAELVGTAKYEVLFSTMEYDDDQKNDGPGNVLAEAIAGLYHQLEENPDRYPRGLTVRVLLGNVPQFATLELNSQLWHVLDDLRGAGIPEMRNDELGWRLEVANYEGAWPHSHAKMLVVDGKVVAVVGFNMEYHHLPKDHRSGLGKGTVDAGIQVTGPVAQDARQAFDELWDGATQRYCRDFHPPYRVWQLTCRDWTGVSDHVPEVMRYYLPGGDTTAISMFRNERYDEADQEIAQALGSAQESLAVLQVMFAMPMICNLNSFYEVCSFDQALPYLTNIVEAAERGARVRLLVNMKPVKGIENRVAVDILVRELERRGLTDRVEIRYFEGPVHAKNALVDDEFLIVGSQNYHYSAYGPGVGLAEYSLGVNDPAAIEAYRRMFDHYWEAARQSEG